mgnify:CR=1 FL=1
MIDRYDREKKARNRSSQHGWLKLPASFRRSYAFNYSSRMVSREGETEGEEEGACVLPGGVSLLSVPVHACVAGNAAIIMLQACRGGSPVKI